MIKLSYPEVISLNTDNTIRNPFTNTAVFNAAPQLFKGIVSSKGAWIEEPAAGWKVELKDVGHYIITHNHGNTVYSTNISLLGKPGDFKINKMDEYVLDIQISDIKNNPINEDFVFCMAITQKIL